jgi:hypothetical protein
MGRRVGYLKKDRSKSRCHERKLYRAAANLPMEKRNAKSAKKRNRPTNSMNLMRRADNVFSQLDSNHKWLCLGDLCVLGVSIFWSYVVTSESGMNRCSNDDTDA